MSEQESTIISGGERILREKLAKLVEKWRDEASRQVDLAYADELAMAIGLEPTFLKKEKP